MDFRKMPELTRNFIVILNNKGLISQIIPMKSNPLDFDSNKLIGTAFSSLISKDNIDKFNAQIKKLKLNKVVKVDFKLVTNKQKIEWYKLSLLKEKNNITIYCNEIDLYKLNQRGESFKQLADLAPIPILGFEYPSLDLNYSNKNFTKELGFDFTEIKHFTQWHQRIVFTDEDDKKKKGIARANYLKRMIKGAFIDGEPLRRLLLAKNGELKRYEISFSILSEKNLYAFFHNITDQYKAQSVLKENANKLKDLIENLPVPVLSYDLTSNSIFANNQNKLLIGHILKKVKNIEDFAEFIVPTKNQPNSKKIFLNGIKLLKTKKYTQLPDNEFSLMCDDKTIHIFKIKRTIIDSVLVLIFKDITDERNAFNQLEKSEKNFRALAQNMPTAIGAYDIDEKIIFLNKHFTKITGYATKDIPTLKEWYKRSQPDVQIRKEAYNFWTNMLNDHKNGISKNKPTLIRKIKCKNGSYKDLNFLFSIAEDTFYVQAIDVTNETIAKKELEQSHEQLRFIAGSLQTEIEKERKYISREIHDELGQQITSIKMQIASLWKKTKEVKYTNEYENILESINNSVQTVRNISTKLRPSILDDFGLIAALEWLIKEFSKNTQAKISYTFNIKETEISKESQLHFFRILQESLTNINRHSKATKVSILLGNINNLICLKIKDNGIGFDTSKLTDTLGIKLMKERILSIDGTFEIKSILNRGSSIKICIPRIKNKKLLK